MRPNSLLVASWLAIGLIAAGCAPPAAPGSGASPTGAVKAPKRVVMAIVGNAPAMDNRLVFNSTIQGADLLSTLVSAGATALDGKGVRHPQLAESVPPPDDGSWRVR